MTSTKKIKLSISIKQNLKADFGAVNTFFEVDFDESKPETPKFMCLNESSSLVSLFCCVFYE